MDTVLVDKNTLQKLLDYVAYDESMNFEECIGMGYDEKQLENHAYSLIKQLQDSINSQ